MISSFQITQTASAATTDDIPVHLKNLGPDLPHVGSSLFDKIFSRKNEKGEVIYKVPYPLDSLLKEIKGAGLTHTMLPFSRSLQRPVDLTYDPLLNPRLVIASTDGKMTRSKIFLGYVKATDQIELISFNDEAGRFEFQLISNYSRNPKVSYAPRGKCVSCHQGQSPIFPVVLWQDTSFGVMGELLDEKLGLSGAIDDRRRETLLRLFGTAASNEDVLLFDLKVRDGDRMIMDERVWATGCGKDTKCRLGLLLNTLAPKGSRTDSHHRYSLAVINKSSLKRQWHFFSEIGPTHLNVPSIKKKYDGQVANTPSALLEIIGNIYRLEGAANPANLRPFKLEDRSLGSGVLNSFSSGDHNAIREAGFDTEAVSQALIALHTEGHPIFTSNAINKLRVMEALLRKLGATESAKYYTDWLNRPIAPKELFDDFIPPVFKSPALNVFSRYCAQCHATSLSFPPQFLMGDESQVISKMSALKPKLLSKLENGLMPPDPAVRDQLARSGDLQILLDHLRQ